jgi:ABC-type branched-subunit amino acid transport system permease subunit
MRYDPPFHKSSGLMPALVVLAGLALLPLLVEASYLRHLMILSFVFGIVAASWDLSLGFGGLFILPMSRCLRWASIPTAS